MTKVKICGLSTKEAVETAVSAGADYLLFDAPVAGSGQTFDWGQLDTTGLAQHFFIAGGLNEDNVVKAIQHFTPYAVDVSSGVETDGQKDHEKIRRFIERVKHGISRTK